MIPGPFRIKLPLELVASNLDEQGYEFAFRNSAERLVVQKILEIYQTDQTLREQLRAEGIDSTQVETAVADCLAREHPAHYLYDKYNQIYRQFDDWALIKSDKDNVSITDIVMKLKADRHIETIDW